MKQRINFYQYLMTRTLKNFDFQFSHPTSLLTSNLEYIFSVERTPGGRKINGCISRVLGGLIKKLLQNDLKQVKITWSKTLDSQKAYRDCERRVERNLSMGERAFSQSKYIDTIYIYIYIYIDRQIDRQIDISTTCQKYCVFFLNRKIFDLSCTDEFSKRKTAAVCRLISYNAP